MRAVDRFIKSLNLGPKVKINKVTTISNRRWTESSIELYHGPRVDDNDQDSDLTKTITSIRNEGFKYKHGHQNKGPGIYFSNNSRYQYLWLTDRIPTFICDIKYQEPFVKRYNAEVTSGYEFVVTKPELIIPKYLVDYTVTGN